MNEITTLNQLKFVNKIVLHKEEFEKAKPYNFNIIDEIYADENAHSRLIAKLLRYKKEKYSLFLEALFLELDLDLIPINPKITVEKDRIDILIKDENYAVIIENKIHFADDQNEQLRRYIERVQKDRRYNLDNIYIFYLTQFGNKKPSENSFPKSLRSSIGHKYLEVTYKTNIYNWLQEILGHCKEEDKALKSGIEQYLDYLDGIFLQRSNDMSDKQKAVIKNEMRFTGEISKDLSIVQAKLKEIEICKRTIMKIQEDLTNELRENFIKELYLRLNQKDNWDCVTFVNKPSQIENAHMPNFGFKKRKAEVLGEFEFHLSVEINQRSKFICGILIVGDSQVKERIYKELVNNGLNIKKTKYWLYLNLSEYDFRGNKIAKNIYDSNWDNFFLNNLEELLDMFQNKILKVDDICTKIATKIKTDINKK